jgi:hypothetical protein
MVAVRFSEGIARLQSRLSSKATEDQTQPVVPPPCGKFRGIKRVSEADDKVPEIARWCERESSSASQFVDDNGVIGGGVERRVVGKIYLFTVHLFQSEQVH